MHFTVHNNEQKNFATNYVPLNGSADSMYSGMGNTFRTGVTLIGDNGNAGMPTAAWYLLISAGKEGTQCQLAIELFKGDIYWRYCAFSKWSEWIQKV